MDGWLDGCAQGGNGIARTVLVQHTPGRGHPTSTIGDEKELCFLDTVPVSLGSD